MISLLIEMGIADTQCLQDAVNMCDSTSLFEYYFWNITNPDAVRWCRRIIPHPLCC